MPRATSTGFVQSGAYLQPDFDPRTLTKANLRSIFVQHEVAYPTNGSKHELIRVFNAEIRPRLQQEAVTNEAFGVRSDPQQIRQQIPRPRRKGSPTQPDPTTSVRSQELFSHSGTLSSRRSVEDHQPTSLMGATAPEYTDISQSNGQLDPPGAYGHHLPTGSEVTPGSLDGSRWTVDNLSQSGPELRRSVAAKLPPRRQAGTLRPGSKLRAAADDHIDRKHSGSTHENVFQSGSSRPHIDGEGSGQTRNVIGLQPRTSVHEASATHSGRVRSTRPAGEDDLVLRLCLAASGIPRTQPKTAVADMSSTSDRAAAIPSRGVSDEDKICKNNTGHTHGYRSNAASRSDAAVGVLPSHEACALQPPAPTCLRPANSPESRLRPTVSPGRRSAFMFAIVVLCAIMTLVFLLVYRSKSAPIGFCDGGTDSNSALDDLRSRAEIPRRCSENLVGRYTDVDVENCVQNAVAETSYGLFRLVVLAPTFATLFPDVCTRCPQHSTCTRSAIQCDRGFTIAPHPLLSFLPYSSLSSHSTTFSREEGLDFVNPIFQLLDAVILRFLDGLPGVGPYALPPYCVEDTEWTHRLLRIRQETTRILSEERGRRLCSSSYLEADVHTAGTNEVQQWGLQPDWLPVLHDFIDSLLWEPERFGELMNGRGVNGEFYVAHRRPHLTWGCTLRLNTGGGWTKWRYHIAAGGVGLVIIMTIRRRRLATAAEDERARHTAQTVFMRLQSQSHAQAHGRDPAADRRPYLFSLRLRDELLQGEHSVAVRQRIWLKVAQIVEANTNIQTSLEETDEGDEMVTWRWLGSFRTSLDAAAVAYGC
ncbi:hypothetical protein EVJ58_g8723 [Rhodofomes roseus]|uniref:LEM domain-containing protein n=1 Tax=Rhodofomes roseus TaxID=34475 RepID=A0A4Y9XY00_9APHY|nr:hypothetical protein EVJ58_g8723 [Rhodofomes roseus]